MNYTKKGKLLFKTVIHGEPCSKANSRKLVKGGLRMGNIIRFIRKIKSDYFKRSVCSAFLMTGLFWPGDLSVYKSERSGGLPDLNGKIRAQPGGTLTISPHGDYFRSAIDILPTTGLRHDMGALGELTLHRIMPDANGVEMLSLCANSREDLPFSIILEAHGTGELKPFSFLFVHQDSNFEEGSFYTEPFKINTDGTIIFGGRRGQGNLADLLNYDGEPVDIIRLRREEPVTEGNHSSDRLAFTAWKKQGDILSEYVWSVNASVWGLDFRKDGKRFLRVNENGLILKSSNGKNWNISITNNGVLKIKPL